MKNKFFSNILLFVFAITIFISCKKDLGNYDYTDTKIPVVDTTGIGGRYSVIRFTNLNISPKVSVAGQSSASLSYQWLVYKTGTASNTNPIVAKELSKERALNVAISETVGDYYLELIVTDQATAIKKSTIFNLSVSAGMDNGLLVLYERDGGGDVDFLTTKNAVPSVTVTSWLKHLYYQSMGGVMDGQPQFISQSRRIGYSSPVMNWITVASSTSIHRMSGNDFSLIRENAALFRRPEAINPQAHGYGEFSLYEALINDGKLYIQNLAADLDALYGGAITGDYYLAPYIAKASLSSTVAAVYDQKNSRFIRPFSGAALAFKAPTATTQPFNLANIGKDMLYMDKGFSNYTNAFFKDKTGNARYMYVINFNKADDGAQGIAAYNMSNLPDILNAKFYQSGELGNVVYYATEDKVYLYDFISTNSASAVFSPGIGEKITCMRIWKPKPNTDLGETENRILYLATWDGTIGRIYELSINPTSGQVASTPLNKFEGFGKIVDMTSKSRGAGLLQ